MLTLSQPFFPRAPQIYHGTVDFRPTNPDPQAVFSTITHDLEALTTQQIPISGFWGVAFARVVEEEPVPTVRELVAFYPWPNMPTPQNPADLRLPPDLHALARGYATPADFPSETSFKAEASAARDALGVPMPCWESVGQRHPDLVTGFTNLSEGVETRDLRLLSNNQIIGRAFIARLNNTQTRQHWVLFDATQPFDQLRVCPGETSYPTLTAFLDAMSQERATRGVPFGHAVETVTHFLDMPW